MILVDLRNQKSIISETLGGEYVEKYLRIEDHQVNRNERKMKNEKITQNENSSKE